MHVGDALRLTCRCCRAADAGTCTYVYTSGLSLEWSQYEFVAAQHIDTQPVDVVERVIEQADEISGTGKRVRFVSKQRADLTIDQFVIGIGHSDEAYNVSNIINACGDHVQSFEAKRNSCALGQTSVHRSNQVFVAWHRRQAEIAADFEIVLHSPQQFGRVAQLDDRHDVPIPIRWLQSSGHWTDPMVLRAEMSEAGYRYVKGFDFLPLQSLQIFVPEDRVADGGN